MQTYIMTLWNNITEKIIYRYFDAYPDELLTVADEQLELSMIANSTRSLEILQIKQIDHKGD